MPVTGDPNKIGQLAQRLRKMAGVPQRTAFLFAPELAAFLREGFESGTTPFGEPFKPLKASTLKKGRKPPPLTASGAAKSALTVTPKGTTDKASLPGYLRYHITTGRAIIPKAGQGWPNKWSLAIKGLGEKAIRQIAEGKV